jgi:hypothetical protein
MITRCALAVVSALMLTVASAHAEPTPGAPGPASAQEQPRDANAASHGSGSFKQDVKNAWSRTRSDIHRTGREIRDGVRDGARATGAAFRSLGRKIKEGFAGTPERAGSRAAS